jgi:hypothetical protein
MAISRLFDESTKFQSAKWFSTKRRETSTTWVPCRRRRCRRALRLRRRETRRCRRRRRSVHRP